MTSLPTDPLIGENQTAQKTAQAASKAELTYLFDRIDRNQDGIIDFEEFSELMLRYRRLMANYSKFMTYFLPIDANGDDVISLEEMNVAMASVNVGCLSQAEMTYLTERSAQPFTWDRFIETMLVV